MSTEAWGGSPNTQNRNKCRRLKERREAERNLVCYNTESLAPWDQTEEEEVTEELGIESKEVTEADIQAYRELHPEQYGSSGDRENCTPTPPQSQTRSGASFGVKDDQEEDSTGHSDTPSSFKATEEDSFDARETTKMDNPTPNEDPNPQEEQNGSTKTPDHEAEENLDKSARDP